MTCRYFVPDLPRSGGLVALPLPEARHATRVMRVQIGDRVTLFDGQGAQSHAIVAQTSRDECHCDAQPWDIVDREPSRVIHLGIALPKSDRARELIERLTELGVKSVTPLIAERTQRPPSDNLLEKLERGVIEACKQCQRNQILQLRQIQQSTRFFAANKQTRRLIAHLSCDSTSLESAKESTTIIAAIGPEGGWTDDEFKLATDHGFEPVNLGKRTYRVETAATVIAAILVT